MKRGPWHVLNPTRCRYAMFDGLCKFYNLPRQTFWAHAVRACVTGTRAMIPFYDQQQFGRAEG